MALNKSNFSFNKNYPRRKVHTQCIEPFRLNTIFPHHLEPIFSMSSTFQKMNTNIGLPRKTQPDLRKVITELRERSEKKSVGLEMKDNHLNNLRKKYNISLKDKEKNVQKKGQSGRRKSRDSYCYSSIEISQQESFFIYKNANCNKQQIKRLIHRRITPRYKDNSINLKADPKRQHTQSKRYSKYIFDSNRQSTQSINPLRHPVLKQNDELPSKKSTKSIIIKRNYNRNRSESQNEKSKQERLSMTSLDSGFNFKRPSRVGNQSQICRSGRREEWKINAWETKDQLIGLDF